MTSVFRVLLVTAMLLLPVGALMAGDIRGVAADITGAALPGARVVLHNLATGATSVVESDAEGKFRFDGLTAGQYSVTVSFVGLSEQSRTVTLADASAGAEVSFLLKPGDLQVDVTVTATRSEREALLVPLRTDTISRDKVESLLPSSTGEVMLQAPGITPVGSGPFQVRPRLRGLDSTRLLVLVDGERLNNARTATDRAGTEVGLADLGAIESFEVVGGSGSVLYGTDALAGTINIITNQPRLSDTLRFSYGFDGQYGSNGNSRRGSVTFGASSKRVAVQIVGTLEGHDDYDAGGKAVSEDTRPYFADGTLTQADTIDDNFGFSFNAFPEPFNAPYVRSDTIIQQSSAKGNNLNAAAVFALTDRQTVQVKYIRRRMENIGFPDFEPPVFFQRTTLPYSNLDRFSARYEARELTPWLANLRVSTYWQDQARLLRTEFPVQFPVPSPRFFPINVFRLNLLTNTEQHVETPGLDIQGTLLASKSHVITVGTTFYHDSSSDTRTNETQTTIIGDVSLGPRGPQPNVYPSPIVLGPTAVTHPTRVPDATFSNLGFFAQDEWEISRLVRLVAGVRVDRYRVTTNPTAGYEVDSLIEGANPPIDPETLPNVDGDRISRTAFTGDVGVVFRPMTGMSLLARYGRSYRHPNLEELLFSGPATVGAIVPNVQVEPETGNNFDVGVKIRSGRYNFDLSYFNNTYDGFISTEIVTTTPEGPLSQAINFSDVRIQGLESSLEIPFTFRPGVVTLFGAFAWTRGDVLRGTNPLTGESLDGTPADNITPFKGMPGVRFTNSTDRYWVEYSARLQSEVKRVAPTLIDSPFLIAQDLLSLGGFAVQRLAWGVNFRQGGNRLGLVFAVENLGDTFYREQFQFAPARGRSFTMGLNVRGF